MKIICAGCGGDLLSQTALKAAEKADIVAAPRRLLESVSLPGNAAKCVLDAKFIADLPRFFRENDSKTILFLASGDPLYHGIGGTLRRLLPGEKILFYPAPTAFQQFFAAIGQPWEGAELFSLHAKEEELPFRRILRSRLCAVYGDAARPAKVIAQELIALWPPCANRAAAAGCDLGTPGEFVMQGRLEEIAGCEKAAASLSVLALLPGGPGEVPQFPLGLPDDSYTHFKNMITHPEIRAVVLSKLRLGPGVMWDLGAGSGSVGLEAALLCPGLTVCAVEKNKERFAQLRENLRREGVGNIKAFFGEGETLLDTLPAPDRVFIGGGGSALLEASFARLKPGGLLVMTGVMLDTLALMESFLPECRSEFLQIGISRSREISPGKLMLAAENPVAVAVWRKGEA